jgi:Homeodomain-like domain
MVLFQNVAILPPIPDWREGHGTHGTTVDGGGSTGTGEGRGFPQGAALGGAARADHLGQCPRQAAPVIAPRSDSHPCGIRAWSHRFHRQGFAGLADAPRSGRPRRHDDNARGTVIALARTKPRSLGLPLALGALARLQQALLERHGSGCPRRRSGSGCGPRAWCGIASRAGSTRRSM